MKSDLYTDEHAPFRDLCRTFLEKECVPHHADWEREGIVPREVWTKAGAAGLVGFNVPVEYGGQGIDDFRYNAILSEEMVRARVNGPGFSVQTDILWPYLKLATEEQRQRWLPGFCTGEIITGVAMTEPGTGSDLQGVQTSATRQSDGSWILNGSKTFISNGILADLVVVFAKTNPEGGSEAFSLLVVERGMDGFERGRNLDKLGVKAQDTAELFFDNVRVPAENLLGVEGHGFLHLMQNLPQERLIIAVLAVAAMERDFEDTLAYCRERTSFGRPIGRHQHVRFELAEMATETQVARAYLDRCIELHNEGRLDATDAAMAKWWTTELQTRIVDRCLQLFGGYGYMTEFPISQAFVDARIQRIYGGTSEIMKDLIGRTLV